MTRSGLRGSVANSELQRNILPQGVWILERRLAAILLADVVGYPFGGPEVMERFVDALSEAGLPK